MPGNSQPIQNGNGVIIVDNHTPTPKKLKKKLSQFLCLAVELRFLEASEMYDQCFQLCTPSCVFCSLSLELCSEGHAGQILFVVCPPCNWNSPIERAGREQTGHLALLVRITIVVTTQRSRNQGKKKAKFSNYQARARTEGKKGHMKNASDVS
eukprot:1050343-Pelagomonas_calceolata.AAC.1